MRKALTLWLACLLSVSASLSQASEKSVTVGVANFPPYSIVNEQGISGAEVEIVRESLGLMGYETEFISYPYGRLPIAFTNKRIDSTIVTLKSYPGLMVYYSQLVLPEYQTVAVHLADSELEIHSISDLEDRSILAHQRAHQFYGEEYLRISQANKSKSKYQETARQETQIHMLYLGRVEVIVLAHEIFEFYKRGSVYRDSDDELVVSKIFGEKFGFFNAFWDQQVRDDFDQGLAQIKANGTYEGILKKYLVNYSPAAGKGEFTAQY